MDQVTVLNVEYWKQSGWNFEIFKTNISVLTCVKYLEVPMKAFKKYWPGFHVNIKF